LVHQHIWPQPPVDGGLIYGFQNIVAQTKTSVQKAVCRSFPAS
jgi:hypothetical protein